MEAPPFLDAKDIFWGEQIIQALLSGALKTSMFFFSPFIWLVYYFIGKTYQAPHRTDKVL
jgi:hypothetical protein